MPYKKRNVRRPRKKMAGKRKTVSKSVKSYVKKIISSNVEDKMYNQYVTNTGITSVAAVTPTNLFLLPQITQGLTTGTRIGNSIKIKRATTSVIVNLLPYNVTTNFLSAPILVRVFLIASKFYMGTTFNTSNPASNLFSVSGGNVGPSNSPIDMLLPFNTDLFTIYGEKQFKIGASSATSAGLISTGAYFDNSSMSKKVTFNWGNKFKSAIKFDDNSGIPSNRNLFLAFVCCNADGSATSSTPCEYHLVNTVVYEDA